MPLSIVLTAAQRTNIFALRNYVWANDGFTHSAAQFRKDDDAMDNATALFGTSIGTNISRLTDRQGKGQLGSAKRSKAKANVFASVMNKEGAKINALQTSQQKTMQGLRVSDPMGHEILSLFR